MTLFQYDNEALVAEYNASNQLLRRYVHGPGIDEPLVWYEGAGTTDRRWLHQDERGSIIAASNSSGTAVTLNSYDEYGVPAPGNLGRFQYTGQAWLPEIGMYHYKARIYAPKLGRFLQTDPIGYEDDINLYAYVGNDPLNGIDPTGTSCGTRIPGHNAANCKSYGAPPKTDTVFVPETRTGGFTTQSEYSQPSFSEAFDERAAEFFRPLAELGDNATDFWAEQGGVLGTTFGTLAATVNSNNIGNTVSTAGTAYLGGSALKAAGAAFGPLKQWIRLGPSYSRALGQSISLSLRWGASPAKNGIYVQQIGSKALQQFNQWLRAQRIPIDSWRTVDPGHCIYSRNPKWA